jgi:hypothetical protein
MDDADAVPKFPFFSFGCSATQNFTMEKGEGNKW